MISCLSLHTQGEDGKIHLEPPEIQFLRSQNFPMNTLSECHQNRLARLNIVEERNRTKEYFQKTFNTTLSESDLDSRMESFMDRIDPDYCPTTEKYSILGKMPTFKTTKSLSITISLKEKMNQTGASREKSFYFSNGKIDTIYNKEPAFPKVEDGRGIEAYPTGISFEYTNGHLLRIGCYFHFEPCNEMIFINSAGEVTKVTKEKNQCKKGCGHLVPYRIPGSYFIADNKVRVRKEPSTKAEIITELNKDTPIEVIGDAEVYEEVFPHYGTWGKVKLDDGREGYVYGAFLRAPGEPDVVAIREKAEEWKKKNGWKGK